MLYISFTCFEKTFAISFATFFESSGLRLATSIFKIVVLSAEVVDIILVSSVSVISKDKFSLTSFKTVLLVIISL